jgi:methylmalonyl-CoA/ethylmalonyl-CoA epimerase
MTQLTTEGLVVTQIGVVVRDIRKSLEIYHDTLGWGPWNVYELTPPRHHHTVVRDEPVEYSMIIAETHVGAIDFELIQPLEGPSIYKEWLDEHGEGIHHVACMKKGTDAQQLLRDFEAQGIRRLMGGQIEDTIEYFYLDTEQRLKIILESGSGHAIDLEPSWVYPDGGSGAS